MIPIPLHGPLFLRYPYLQLVVHLVPQLVTEAKSARQCRRDTRTSEDEMET